MLERNLRVRGSFDGGTGKASSTGSHAGSNVTLRSRVNPSIVNRLISDFAIVARLQASASLDKITHKIPFVRDLSNRRLNSFLRQLDISN